MKKIIQVYLLLIIAFILQVSAAGQISWMPDLILLMVVFEGMFRSGPEAVVFALVAGAIRGSLSFGTFSADIFTFPIIGAMGFLEGRIFYRYNPVAQVLITTIAVCLVVFIHVLCLKTSEGRCAGFFTVLTYNWKPLLVTIVSAPGLFFLLSRMFHLED
ncbi:MAG: rod shape-determining protein MreD [Candidatus Aadella gelida]|nr:rod shape-determining protein MreD [Candidatus Aadella gelida]